MFVYAYSSSPYCFDCYHESDPIVLYKVQSLEWRARPGNDALGDCPNNGGKQIFPGKMSPTDVTPAARRQVDLVATVYPPIAGIQVYFKVWDVDDPFDQLHGPNAVDPDPGTAENEGIIPNVELVDNDRDGPDNRPTPETPMTFIATTAVSTNLDGEPISEATVTVTVSMQPGNNYRAAATVLNGVVNGLSPQVDQSDADELSVWEYPVGTFRKYGNVSGYVVPVVWSPMLTIWRKLHVELDSMGPVTDNNIESPFIGIVGSGAVLTEINGLNSLDDGSANLDKVPPGNGRFENGTLVIGTAPNTITISPVTANGSNRVVFPPTSIAGLPFSAVDNDDWWNGTMSGTIANVTESGINFAWALNVAAHNEDPIDWADFVGGKLTVGGGAEVVIVATGATTPQLTTSTLNIPCRIHDDDDDTLLPKLPDTSTMTSAYQAAYVLSVYDVGNSDMNVPFVLNVPEDGDASLAIQRWDSKSQNAADFWVAYLLEGYQSWATNDDDPNLEESDYADTIEFEGGSTTYVEIHQTHEGVADPAQEERDTVVHETAHAVGGSGDEPVTDGNSNLRAVYLDLIRSATRPWP